MPYPRAGLDYYALSGSAPIAKLATFVREQGGVRATLGALRGLGAVDHDTAWANLLAGWAWYNEHPLPDDVDPNSELAQSRALITAALVAAQNRLQNDGTAGSSDPAYQQVASAFQAHAGAARRAQMPSAFMQGLDRVSDRLINVAGTPFNAVDSLNRILKLDPSKLLLIGGAVLGAYLLLPSLLARRRTA